MEKEKCNVLVEKNNWHIFIFIYKSEKVTLKE